WEINGKTMRVTPSLTGDQSNGMISLSVWNGSDWESPVTFRIKWADDVFIPGWDFVTCLRNDPECVALRLIRDAREDSETTAKHELDITVRRGCHLVTFVYKFDGVVPEGH